ncbi:hypothetical protein ORV05_05055 [Amycolatopsis cynarae]|uniref:Uncharacterized protein n=1 Tax=Amycolatopsis cynarae TaxID=2995223 RepID=A0ABY7B4P9_9PSEU|nr:hypothetical protein [Amycolatopsis sp. HUAS 11-8]WAL67161.1 hypothetical protein ORV05_05055 [Amycolatopsis sp. HUAS 11-8]
MRTAYDAINSLVPNIPTDAQIVCGYVSPSSFAWSDADWARFPRSVKVRITPSAARTGLGIHVLDVEQYDATPGEAPGWAAAQRALGQTPTIYCSQSAWQSVQDAFTAAHVAQPEYWIAAYPGGGQVLPTLNGITAVAHQWSSDGIYDRSIVADHWPGVDTQGGADMQLTDTFVDWAGNAQTVQSWMDHVDQRIAELHAALLALQPSRIPGDTNSTTPVDAIMDTVATVRDGAKGLPAVANAVKAITAPTVDVATLATALKDTLAPDIVKALGQKLVN